MDAIDLQSVEKFIEEIESHPSLLGHTSMSFFRDFMTSLKSEIPPSAYKRGKRTKREVVGIIVEAEMAPPEKGKMVVRDEGGKKHPPSPRPPRRGGGGIVIRD